MRRLIKIACSNLLFLICVNAAFTEDTPKHAQISQTGYELIKRFEGFSSRAYPDAITGGAPWTYGYGFIKKDSGEPVFPDDVIPKAKAEKRLVKEVDAQCGSVIRKVNPVHLTQNRVDAAASFCWNIGPVKFSNSLFFRHWSVGNIEKAAKSLSHWVASGTNAEQGLRARRDIEQQVFRAKGPVLVGNLR